jgi:membrane-bound lytic murein transglycosylase D
MTYIDFETAPSHPRYRMAKVTLVATILFFIFANAACTTHSRKSHSRRLSQAEGKSIRFTSIRDPLIRAEIHEELNSLQDLERARRDLRASYENSPLPGPLTVNKLEAELVAKFQTEARQKAYTQLAGQSKNADEKTGDVSPASPFADVVTGGDALGLAPRISTPASRIPSANELSTQSVAGLPPGANEPGMSLSGDTEPQEEPRATLKKLSALENSAVELSSADETPLIFDYPVTYNAAVRRWVTYFQTSGRSVFRSWLERSSRFLPFIQYELAKAGLPQDLAYVAMIESGFSPTASSHASAIGLWQFIGGTGNRYGLRTEWWLDERRDFLKSTRGAIRYMTDLYRQFSSWYLVAASYNMGEYGVERLIKRYRTHNFWELADLGALPQETKNYVPKIIAAMLISKAPALYGFRDIDYQLPLSYEYFHAPGGTDLINLAKYLGVSEKYLKELNPELIKGFIPRNVASHKIRIPQGSEATVAQFVRLQASN